jgi:hypothetical protein
MTAESVSTSTSRRAILAAGVGSLVALVAQALGRPSPARSGTDGDVALGEVRNAAATTGVTTSGGNGIQGILNAASDQVGSGVYGEARGSTNAYGVTGRNTQHSGVGVLGEATDSTAGIGVLARGPTGVEAQSDTGIGVNAYSYGAEGRGGQFGGVGQGGTGVLGYSYTGTGIQGHSGSSVGFRALSNIGVYGKADQDATARGVVGESIAGTGVVGAASSGSGVRGFSSSGPGGYFSSSTGDALVAQGKARHLGPVFFKFAGLATIAARTRSKTVAPAGIDITASSKVLVTLQSYPGGTISVQRVARDATNNRFTVYLTANAVYNTTFAWFVIS